ncbi:unnamed protein product [Toxocara canis]|uniref:ANK_REP_REGION domain-containing protein n=1 Tax=Toxocara canis TaxID=6265 RepID=A0A183URD4_TOXCA|nr:unnamed protein product [Toxocara canis]
MIIFTDLYRSSQQDFCSIGRRRYTGESSECSSLVGTPTDTGRSFTFTAQRALCDDHRPSLSQNLSEMMLEAIHMDDVNMVDRLLASHANKSLCTSPSIGSMNTLTELAQRRQGNHRRLTCAVMNTLHIAIAHKQRDIVELLLKSGCDPNATAVCHCKGSCAAMDNIPLTSIVPRAHSVTPELCSTCAQLRVVSITDHTPLGVAVREQSTELIALLFAYGADVNLGDEDGNTPLMLAVRESPLSWHCLRTLIFFGAQIEQKNLRGICPLDLAPELRKLQQSCVEDLFKNACCIENGSHGSPETVHKLHLMGSIARAPQRRLHVDSGSIARSEKSQSTKMPLSPKASAAPSVSTFSMLDTTSTKESARRKSLVSLQLHRRSKSARDYALVESITWEQAWELLKKMATNPECLDTIQASLLKFASQMESASSVADGDSFDSHLGGLLHRVLHTAIAQYQSSTQACQRAKKQQLIGVLSTLTTFCFLFLQKSGTNRQFAALNTLNKIIDAGLVHDLFAVPEIVFHSSRLLNRTHNFYSDEDACSSTCHSLNSNKEQSSTVDHVLFCNAPRKCDTTSTGSTCETSPQKTKTDLTGAFSNVDPSLVIACLHNAITMQNREAGSRSVCSPAHRWRQCWQHCTQILVARILLFLCHIRTFQSRLSERPQLKALIQLLEPTLDPQLLCLLLQSIALIALDPNTHRLFVDMQIDDVLIQMLLPADDWYYTNHSTKFGQFVKYHAARILVYVGMGDRVGSRVSLFHFPENTTESKKTPNYANEDEYICETCSTPSIMQACSRCAMSVEGILQKVLGELVKNSQHSGATEPIIEESSSAASPPPFDSHPVEEGGGPEIRQQLEQKPSTMQISLENLEAQLCKLGLVLDSMLLLRLLLHKLSWDLNLVVKKRAALFDNHTYKTINDPRARSSWSLGNSSGYCFSSLAILASHKLLCQICPIILCIKLSTVDSGCIRRGFVKSKSFDRREDDRKDRNFLRVDQGSRMSKRVQIRRLGTDTSSGSSRSKKTSSTSSVQKHLPKYIQSLFRGRMGTDPCKRHIRRDSSPDSNTSGSDAVLEFARKLQNYPLTRREALRQAYRKSERQNSLSENHKSAGYTSLPELEINGASPPRSPISDPLVNAVDGHDLSLGVSCLTDHRPSSPQAIPGLPLIEIRRPSALSQFDFGYFVSSADMSGSETSECAPLLMTSNGTQISSRKSSDESSVGVWSSRASSMLSQRSSSGGLRLSAFSAGTSIASDNSGPFLFSFVLRNRASTIGTRIPLPKSAISRNSGDSLRVPDRESPVHPIMTTEMNPDFQCVRQLILNLLTVYSKQNANIVSTMKECADVLRQILNSPQHPTVKNWCAEIIQVVSTHVEPEQESALESTERVNDEYLDFQDQIISGSLPCPKEEAALLASIQLCVEENWPSNKRTQTIRRHLLKGQFGWFLLFVEPVLLWKNTRSRAENYGNTMGGRPNALLHTAAYYQQRRDCDEASFVCRLSYLLNWLLIAASPFTLERKYSIMDAETRSRSSTLLRCIADPDALMSAEVQAQCLPIDLRGDRRTVKLVKERKRKLFHSQIYESEIGMKKLYVQTAKKLPAFGCKVFQVKELVHGRTLRKVSVVLIVD